MATLGRAQHPDTERLTLWQEVSGTMAKASSIFVPRQLVAAARMTLTFVLIGSVAVSGWIASVSASQNSLPGEALYVVDLATDTCGGPTFAPLRRGDIPHRVEFAPGHDVRGFDQTSYIRVSVGEATMSLRPG